MCVFSALFFCGQPPQSFPWLLTITERFLPLDWPSEWGENHYCDFDELVYKRQDTFQWLHCAGEMQHMCMDTFTICLQILADAVVWRLPFLLAFSKSKPVQTYCRKKWITSYSTAQGFCWPFLMTFLHVSFEHRWFLHGSLWILTYATFDLINCSCVFSRQCAELAVRFFQHSNMRHFLLECF